MKLTGELLTKARTAKSPEELVTIADKMGVTVSESDAALYYNRLHTEPELTDEELEAIEVSGGGCGGGGDSGDSVTHLTMIRCIRADREADYDPHFCPGCEHLYSERYAQGGGMVKAYVRNYCKIDPHNRRYGGSKHD
ncbi:MAG: hypothetical protein LBL98_08460 [Ruminococcus sp.]|nr:hypothetical protein [Ruminococcus sp.]